MTENVTACEDSFNDCALSILVSEAPDNVNELDEMLNNWFVQQLL